MLQCPRTIQVPFLHLGGFTMTGEMRREEILERLMNSTLPLSGTQLAKQLQVSRQIIVQDISNLRNQDHDILSTNRGYIYTGPRRIKRILKVKHDHDDIVDELSSIINHGGAVTDVTVKHNVFGQIKVDLQIRNHRDVEVFMDALASGRSTPLMNVTGGYHYHTIEADSEVTLDNIETTLGEKGYLVE